MRDDRDRRRRRSRSPRHSSRRDYEVDTYSSSRDYREREREDTYARRERRDDRGWGGGDSYSRRDHPRRDDDRGFGRRDRDGHDERGDRGDRYDRERGDRGRGRRGDRERDAPAFGGRDRKKSASPPFKKREPTPDLSDVVSIQKRQRRMTQWDIKPAGYENITAEQAKLSGMFPLPGAPRAAPMDPSRLAAFMNPAAGSASASALKPENAKQAKRLFVHNIPAETTPETITGFFNLQMNGLNVVSGPDPCISAQINPNREYALLEFKTPEDATMALTMDGMLMEDDPNRPDKPGLSIRRPKDYIVPLAPESEDSNMVGVVSSVVKDGPNKLSINHLPPNLDEAQLRELLEVFGQLKGFVLVQDSDVDPNNFQSRVSHVRHDQSMQLLILVGRVFLSVRRYARLAARRYHHGPRRPRSWRQKAPRQARMSGRRTGCGLGRRCRRHLHTGWLRRQNYGHIEGPHAHEHDYTRRAVGQGDL